MNKQVNLNGYATPGARARRTRRAFSASAIISTLRALGLSDDEIKAEMLKIKQTAEINAALAKSES